ncbi:hypothetical protein Tco_0696799 [Tanacetum coccineum]
MHQPWRTFAVVINRCIFGKSISLDRIRPLRAQILWGMFYKKNVDFVALLNMINLHTIRDDSLLVTLKYVSKIEDYQKYGTLIPKQMINQVIKDSKEYKIYLAFATGEATPKKVRKFKKIDSPSKKQTLILEEESAKKPKQAKQSAPAKKDVPSKKPSKKQSIGVQIRDTPGASVSKKNAPATTVRSKGIDLLFEAAILEEAQVKTVLKWSE